MYSKWIEALLEGKKVLIWLKAPSWCVLSSCQKLYDLGLSGHPHFHLVGCTVTQDWKWQVTSMSQSLWLSSFDEIDYCNEIECIPVSRIIRVNLCWVLIQNNQLHDSHTQIPITALKPLQNTPVSTSNPIIIYCQHSPSCINMINKTIKYTTHQKETQNHTKKLHMFTHTSTLQSARTILSLNANP